ncbi:MAG: S1C family serine protease, partial [Bacilli bacterium]
MGYYDDIENQNTEQNEEQATSNVETPQRKQSPTKKNTLFTAFIGAIIGALLVIITLPFLVNNGYINIGSSSSNVSKPTNVKADKQIELDVQSAVTKAVEQVSDAVVGVVNIQQNAMFQEEGEAGTGSGVIYKKDGKSAFVVTNHHVVEGAMKLEVHLSNGERVPAKLLGSDIYTDLAVLEIDASKVTTVAEFGSSSDVKRGEPVIAIGSPLGLEFSGTVTQGIISGTERIIPVDLNKDGKEDWQVEVLQTDAAINPGNSGGALVNMDGKVVGINSMKIAQQAVEGMGLSIPIDIAEPIVDQLERLGKVERPYLGVELRDLNEISTYHWKETLLLPDTVSSGAVIMSVVNGSPAANAGIKQYDVVVKMDGKPVTNVIDLRKILYSKQVNDEIEVKVYSEGKL